MMARVQISMPLDEHCRARARATELGVSLSAYVRQLIRADLGTPARPADVSALFDLGDSGGSDVARDKDAYLARALRRT